MKPEDRRIEIKWRRNRVKVIKSHLAELGQRMHELYAEKARIRKEIKNLADYNPRRDTHEKGYDR